MKEKPLITRLEKLSPAQMLMLYYALAIISGALLLTTPMAAKGEPLGFLDALFTATSAQCVTGLIVVDTGTRLSLFGQSVVLMLIQIGVGCEALPDLLLQVSVGHWMPDHDDA